MSRNRILSVLLTAVPFVAICFSVPLWDRVYPLVLGLPFNLAWLIVWIPLTTVCMAGVYWLQKRDEGSRVPVTKKDASR